MTSGFRQKKIRKEEHYDEGNATSKAYMDQVLVGVEGDNIVELVRG